MEETPRQWLEKQHHDIDDGVKAALTGADDPAPLRQALALLREHIYLEEAVLFPPIEQSGITMPVFVMQREHGQMWPLMDALAAAVESGDADDLQAQGRELFQLLQIHNRKEEQIIYSAADNIAAEAGDGALLQALKDAHMPTGWACAMAPA